MIQWVLEGKNPYRWTSSALSIWTNAFKYPAITSGALKVVRKLRSHNLYFLSVVIKAVTSGGKSRICTSRFIMSPAQITVLRIYANIRAKFKTAAYHCWMLLKHLNESFFVFFFATTLLKYRQLNSSQVHHVSRKWNNKLQALKPRWIKWILYMC